MKRADIIEAAKQLVLSHGPSNIIEFGSEYIEADPNIPEADREAVDSEATKQANRVYSFLGYERRS